ncbi:toll/interleukin-1 receptor domain-containing protein [Streptomyces sp. NPDC096310]|uniref:toll/interleukin-1 receptor domain-containing protein n=1 Tax=Streptomyces sp. NPDC096310 TaxID=3366082 RepID=UPI003805955D
MADIFINYRTHDGEETAVALEQALNQRFGKGRAFRASASIKPGELYDDKLLAGVRRSSVLVAVIGRHWAESPRLHERDDWVRKEILEAFRCAIPVIPVLVGRETKRLQAVALPTALRRLARLQSLRYDTQNAECDMRRIGDDLAEEVPALAEAEAAMARRLDKPAPGSVNNSMGTISGGTNVQTGDITGDMGGIGGTVIREANGPVHTGPGDQHHHAPRLTGDGASYVAGDQHGGGNRQTFGVDRRRRDDDR